MLTKTKISFSVLNFFIIRMLKWNGAIRHLKTSSKLTANFMPTQDVSGDTWEQFEESKKPKNRVFKKRNLIGSYEYDDSVPVADRYAKGPYRFHPGEKSIYSKSVKLGSEINRTGSSEPNLTRQHFMNTLYSNGKGKNAKVFVCIIQ